MNGELRSLYREQYDMYPSLSQEEVEKLYASEGISDKQASEIVREIEDEISALNSERDACVITTIKNINAEQKERYQNLSLKIQKLEEKKEKITKIQRELQGLLPGDENSVGLLSSIAIIDNEIERLYRELQSLDVEQSEANNEIQRLYEEYNNRICELEDKLDKIKLDYASIFRQLYSSSRGIIKKNRKFPSVELRNKIVLGHLEFAKKLAGKYFKLCDHAIEYDELVQIANEALMSAAYYYVPSPRASFKTYARKCIENKLKRAIGEVKKKQKKRPSKPLEFLDEELRRIDYIMMFIDANRNVSKRTGKKFFSNRFHLSPTGVQRKFKESLLSYNRERRELGEYKLLLPGFKIKKSEKGLQDVMSIAMRHLKESKIKVLVSEDEIEMASMVVSYENHSHELHEIYELLYILDLYKSRLINVRTLLEAEIDLASGADGIVPSSEEILAQINQKITCENKGIYKAKHSPNPVSYNPLLSYYELYDELWGIDLLAPSEFENSRFSEKNRLAESHDKLIRFYKSFCSDLVDDALYLEDDQVHLYLHQGEEVQFGFFDFWNDEDFCYVEKRVFSREQAIEFFKGLIKEIESMTPEEYVVSILEKKKQITLQELNARNAKIIKNNRDKEDIIRYQKATKYVRYWTVEQVKDVSNWLSLLYESGLFVKYSNNHKTPNQSLSLEDEVIENMFREDYLKALKELSPLAQKIMLMYYDENGTHSAKAKEIASELGIKESDVYREKNKALKFLKKSESLQSYLE